MRSIALFRGPFVCNRRVLTVVALFVGITGLADNAVAQELPGASGMAPHTGTPN